MYLKKSKVNILINIFLCLFAFMITVFGAEFALRRINIEGLSGERILLGKDGNSEGYRSLAQQVSVACKDFEFTMGHCYPSDTTGRLPLKVLNPDDHKYWYCVPYNAKQRFHGYNPNRKRQIALVGDSFVFGEGVKETDTLGYLLNEKNPKINFQNFGEPGANINTVMDKCKAIIKSRLMIDEVIYFYNLNDVRMSEVVSSQQRYIMNLPGTKWSNYEKSCGTLETMLSKSALFSLVRKVLIKNRTSSLNIQSYKDMYLGESNRQEFLLTMDEIQSIKDMLAARGISFRLIIYPLLYKDIWGRYPLENIHAVIASACRERGIIYLDGYVPFKSYYSLKRFTVHPLDYHPNGLSNRVLVDYIHEKG